MNQGAKSPLRTPRRFPPASEMLDPEDVAAAVLLACTQSAKSRIIQIQMRTMAESLT